jgi:hypothetical protein
LNLERWIIEIKKKAEGIMSVIEWTNILLVVVTAVYAFLTYRISKGGGETNKALKHLADAMKEGQAIQNEMNFLKFVEIKGNTHLNKRGLDKGYPNFYARWKEMAEK